MSPNHLSSIENKAELPKEIDSKLEKIYTTTWLEPNEVYAIYNSVDDEKMNSCENTEDGRVEQHLLAVLKAGDEFFNILNVNTLDKTNNPRRPLSTEAVAVTKRIPGGRAELIDFIDIGEKVNFGRRHQGQDLGDTVSGSHFAIGVRADGTLGLEDFGSTNGSKLYEQGPKSKKSLEENPVDDIDFWSVKSSDMKSALYKWHFGE